MPEGHQMRVLGFLQHQTTTSVLTECFSSLISIWGTSVMQKLSRFSQHRTLYDTSSAVISSSARKQRSNPSVYAEFNLTLFSSNESSPVRSQILIYIFPLLLMKRLGWMSKIAAVVFFLSFFLFIFFISFRLLHKPNWLIPGQTYFFPQICLLPAATELPA